MMIAARRNSVDDLLAPTLGVRTQSAIGGAGRSQQPRTSSDK
jgi:hypothetical protein